MPSATLSVTPQGVAVITLDNPPVNALHPDVLNQLFVHLQTAHSRRDVKAIVVVGARNKFSAGFDINKFAEAGGGGIDSCINNAFCDLLESGPKPTVAAIETLALGGGCEVALACNARVAAPGASIGLPELQLGILPGFGGTQRLPRLVGLQQALTMILTSAPVKADKALKLGLVDQVVPPDQLLSTASTLALDIAAGRRPRQLTLYRTDKLEPFAEATAILDMAREQTRRRAPNLQHPLFTIDAVAVGIAQGGRAGLAAEERAFAAAAALDTHRALVHIFFAQRATKKVGGVTDRGLKPRAVGTVAVLGGGLMGSGIATACALSGMQVLLKEVNQKFLDAGIARVRANLASRVKKGRMRAEQAEAVGARVRGVLDYAEFGRVDMVIEAVIEDVKLKQQIFADLERACKPDAILSSNTSTIDLTLIGAKTSCPERIVGAHFFSPAHVMPLLEIVRTNKTSPQVVLDTIDFGLKIKKTPVVVGNCTGFAVNRVFFPYTQAACMLVDMGGDPYAIDKAITAFGMPMGPFRLSDLVGADIGLHVGKNFIESFPDRVYPARLILLLNEAGRLGEKTGRGFYAFDAKTRRAKPDPEVATLVAESRKGAGLMGATPPRFSPKDVEEFIFFPVVNEACRVIEEGIVDKPADLDVATVMAMGFPPYRGGLVFWADLVGAAHIVQRLEQWEAQFAPRGLGGFFKPCAYLKRAAAEGTKLGAGRRSGARL